MDVTHFNQVSEVSGILGGVTVFLSFSLLGKSCKWPSSHLALSRFQVKLVWDRESVTPSVSARPPSTYQGLLFLGFLPPGKEE